MSSLLSKFSYPLGESIHISGPAPSQAEPNISNCHMDVFLYLIFNTLKWNITVSMKYDLPHSVISIIIPPAFRHQIWVISQTSFLCLRNTVIKSYQFSSLIFLVLFFLSLLLPIWIKFSLLASNIVKVSDLHASPGFKALHVWDPNHLTSLAYWNILHFN